MFWMAYVDHLRTQSSAHAPVEGEYFPAGHAAQTAAPGAPAHTRARTATHAYTTVAKRNRDLLQVNEIYLLYCKPIAQWVRASTATQRYIPDAETRPWARSSKASFTNINR